MSAGTSSNKKREPSLRRVGIVLCVGLALLLWGHAGTIHAKALVAQWLIHHAWQDARKGAQAPPWPWADFRPVALLHVPAQGETLYVLDNDSARTLAFGPGMRRTSDDARNTVISAHRDTHFRFLQHVRVGEEIALETTQGTTQRYRIVETLVVDQDDTWITRDNDALMLTLVTCYPFDAVVPGGRKRYVVRAELVVTP